MKYAKFSLAGESCPPFLRAKAGRHKADIFNVMRSTHVEFQLDCMDDLTEEVVINRLKTVQGAHQPQYYEF
jgi:hypothetical protein